MLHRVEFKGNNELKADFPHRSIQEFFAAFYCHQLIITPDKTERNSAIKEVLKIGSQFGRFLFGICSDENKFEEMLEWLNLTFDDIRILERSSVPHTESLLSLSASLRDCSEAEAKLLGQRLATSSLDQQEKKIRQGSKFILSGNKDLLSMNTSFRSGLNFSFLDEEGLSWSLTHVDKPTWSRLTCVFFHLPVNLPEKFDQIQIFIWRWATFDLAGMSSSIDRLRPISTLIIQTQLRDFEVSFDLNYEMTEPMTTTSAAQLRHFSFGFDKHYIPSLKCMFSDEPDTEDFIIGGTTKCETHISRGTVRVIRSLNQSQLVRILIRLAVATYSSGQLRKRHLI